MPSERIRASLLLAAFAACFALQAWRDVPAEIRKVRREHALLAGLPNDERRLEMWRPVPGAPPEHARTYPHLKRYLAFMDRIRRETPDDARVGLVGVPWNPLGKYAHYFLYPRHPFTIEHRDPARAVKAWRLDYLATFEGESGRVERVR